MSMRLIWGAATAALCALALAACGSSGGGETTTVIREVQAPAPAAERHPAPSHRVPAKASTHKPSGEAPNVVDLPLDVAEEVLEEAGYTAAPTNNDTAFGIMVPSHFTVCTQDDPRGHLVPLLAQKYGC